jgi:F-type H+-transporting ATPase subunit delta
MIKEIILSKRYGEAFLGYAGKSMSLEEAAEELRKLKLFIHGYDEFMPFLGNRQIAVQDKSALMDKVLSGSFRAETVLFLKFLVERGRVEYLDGICDYVRVRHSSEETVDVLLKTTYPLEGDLIQVIRDKVARTFGGKLNFFTKYDPGLLGGVQLIIGNKILDGSVKRRIEDLKERLLKVRVSG